jgi:hypothetical protein
MTAWTPQQLEKIGSTDDFHISPYRDDGTTPGTPTWIWSVVIDGDVYVRAYNGTASRWHSSAMTKKTQFAKDSGPNAAANRAKRAAQLPIRTTATSPA